jgi:hypothetical protein
MRYESSMYPRFRAAFVVAAVALALTGCGGAEQAPVDDVARAFYAAVQEQDGTGACGLLAPETRSELEQSEGKACSTAVLEQHFPEAEEVRSTRVYGTMAQVRYDGDTVFLARFPSGWKVIAVGCSKTPSSRYDCEVKS